MPYFFHSEMQPHNKHDKDLLRNFPNLNNFNNITSLFRQTLEECFAPRDCSQTIK